MEEDLRGRPAKRRRVAVACDHCRRRKIRCDGLQPLCSYCLDHDVACVYQKVPQRVQVSQSYLDTLVKQVEELQRTNACLAQQLLGPSGHGYRFVEQERPASPSRAASPVSTIQDAGVTPVFPLPASMSGSKNGVTSPGEPAADDTESVTDAMVCAGSPPPAGGSYFGRSSTLSFLEVVQTMAFRSGTELVRGLRSTGRRGEDTGRSSGSSEIPMALSIKSRLLPPRSTADHLIDTYFSHVSDLYTVLHEPTFREEYERLWLPGSQPDGLWFCILNGVFALASLFSDRLAPEESESTARTFFGQAKELFNFDNLDCGSLDMVQALLLIGQYLQSTKRVNRCWYVFGLAIRIAQGLGLQLSDINNKCAPVERETRKRCWCGCLVMDTMLAMTFGRPMMIPSEHYYNAEMPDPVDDARITATPIAPQAKESASPKILLFIHKVRLSIILHSILRTLYQAGGRDDGETKFRGGDMMEFDQQLCAWLESLPPCMRMKEPFEENLEDSPSARPRNVLYTRYLTVRILLTRPSLAVVARMAVNSSSEGLRPLNQTFAVCAAETCINTSKRLVDHIRTNLGLERRFLGAAWYNTHSVFSAALVLFAAQIIPALRPHISDGGRHWKDSIDVMRLLSRRCSSARACLSMLELFNRHLTQSSGSTTQQQTGLEEIHMGFSDCSSTSPSIFFQDWADALGLDELIGREFPPT